MSAAPAPTLRDTRPSPEEIDRLASEYSGIKEKLATAQSRAGEIAGELESKAQAIRTLVSEYGSAHAHKSKILHGIRQELMVTYGQTTTIDAAAVETFRVALVKDKKARLLRAVFEKTIRWTLQPQASEVIRGSKLSDRLRGLAAKCTVIVPRTPSVTARAKA